jgi:flagellar hook-associated protein 3 FlgL
MRVTTAQTFDHAVDELQRRQQGLAESQLQLTSGKRVQRASDDPSAAARAERALAAISRSSADQRALEASRNAMTLTESALGDAAELLQQARETMVAAGNASYSDGERAALAARLRELRSQLLAVANRGDGVGGYLFGGQGAGAAPFVDAAGGVVYRGTAGAAATAGSEPLPLSVNGEPAWMRARSGNGAFVTTNLNSSGAHIDAGRVTDAQALTGQDYRIVFGAGGSSFDILRGSPPVTVAAAQPYVSGRAIEVDGMAFTIAGAPAAGDEFTLHAARPELSVFDVLDRALLELTTPLRTNAQVTQTVATTLRDLDASMHALQGLRAAVGEVLARTDLTEARIAASRLHGQTERSNAEDLDMVQAISQFQQRQSGYDAALRAYAMVQRMSLFQHL